MVGAGIEAIMDSFIAHMSRQKMFDMFDTKS